MRAYVVKNTVSGAKRFAGTQAEVRETKAEMGDKKDLSVEEVDVPMAKAELLNFINGLLNQTEETEE